MLQLKVSEMHVKTGHPVDLKETEATPPISLVAWLCLFLAVILAYQPGLRGPFMLNDFASIGAMGRLDNERLHQRTADTQ